MGEVVSGMIATSLAQQPVGSTDKLRDELTYVLHRLVKPIAAQPPADDHPHRQRLRALLDICLPDSEVGAGRKLILYSQETQPPPPSYGIMVTTR